MASLKDFMAAYNQVIVPSRKSNQVISAPLSKYDRLVSFIESKSKPTETTEETSEPWKWIYTETQSQTQSPDSWREDLTKAYKRLGLSDNAIKNLIAKNALESGWGKSTGGKYNYGNITAGRNWSGNITEGEDVDSNGNKIKQKWRSYNSIDDFARDEVGFLTSLYDFNQEDDINTFLNKLQGENKGKRRYAEARDYKDRVIGVYNSL